MWKFKNFSIGVEWNAPGQYVLGPFLLINREFDDPWEAGLALGPLALCMRGREDD